MANSFSTTQVLQILPKQGISGLKKDILVVGEFVPPDKPGVIEMIHAGESGCDPMTEVGQTLVTRLLREKQQVTPVGSLANGLELFDPKKTRVIAASTHGTDRYDDLAEAAACSTPESIESMRDVLKNAPKSLTDDGTPIDDAAEVFRRNLSSKLTADCSPFAPVFGAVWSKDLLQLKTEVKLLQSVYQAAGKDADQQALVTANAKARAIALKAVDETKQHLSNKAKTYANGLVALDQIRSGGAMPGRVKLLNLGGLSPEELFADPPAHLIDELQKSFHDVIVTTPIKDVRPYEKFVQTYCGLMPELHCVLYLAFTNYRDAAGLAKWGGKNKPVEGLPHGHLCILAGKTQHEMLGPDLPVVGSWYGLRLFEDRNYSPADQEWGLANATYGAHFDHTLRGLNLGHVDTEAWSESTQLALLENGINVIANTDGVRHLRGARSRSTISQLMQIDATRFRSINLAAVRHFLAKAAPGRFGNSFERRELAKDAGEVWEPWANLDGFSASVKPGKSGNPFEFEVDMTVSVVPFFEKVKILSRVR